MTGGDALAEAVVLATIVVVLVAALALVVERLVNAGGPTDTEPSGGDPRQEPGTETEPDAETGAETDGEGPDPLDLSYAARVVTREDGDRVGESVVVAEDRLIVKGEDTFYAVPVANVAESGEALVARDVDWDRAADAGGDWEEAHSDPLDFDQAGMPR